MRIGITQRVTYDPDHGERRDALAADWHRFLAHVWPDVVVVPIPNRPDHVRRLFEAVALEGLILSGGNDIGSEPERDQTERSCLDEARALGLPVIGVCRGFQMMVAAEGGRIAPVDGHVATRHLVRCLQSTRWGWEGDQERDVNSFHRLAVPADGLPRSWLPLAQGADRTVEAAATDDGRCIAVMWHPERETAPSPLDLALFREAFGRGTGP